MRCFNRLLLLITLSLVLISSTCLLGQTLQNGGMNKSPGYWFWAEPRNTSLVANNWNPWIDWGTPQFKPSDFEKIEGDSCQQIWSDGISFGGGIYQQITGCVVSRDYQAMAWFMSMYGPDGPFYYNKIGQKIGIDPYGGTDRNAGTIIWSGEDFCDRTWREISVVAKAQSSTITVFLKVNDSWAGQNCRSFFDYVRLNGDFVAISNLKFQLVKHNEALVTWTTNKPADSKVQYITDGRLIRYDQSVTDSTYTTSHSLRLKSLLPGTTYNWMAVSYANGVRDCSINQQFTTLAGTVVNSIADAKTRVDNNRVIIRNAVVTVGNDQVYDKSYAFIEDTDRSCGIRLSTTSAHTLRVGDMVDVSGILGTTSTKERQLTSVTVATNDVPYGTLIPALVTANALGGARLNNYTEGVTGGRGPNNVGSLVRICGKVTAVDTSSRYFYVDDGTGYTNGIVAAKGVPVYYGKIVGTLIPVVGQTVGVTGASTIRAYNGVNVPMVTLRSPGDYKTF